MLRGLDPFTCAAGLENINCEALQSLSGEALWQLGHLGAAAILVAEALAAELAAAGHGELDGVGHEVRERLFDYFVARAARAPK